MKHVIKHDLARQTAHNVMNKAFESYAARFAQYNPTLRWEGLQAHISLSIMGKAITGLVDLGPGQILLDLKVPFMMRAFKGQAIKVIEDEVRTWIGRAKAGQL